MFIGLSNLMMEQVDEEHISKTTFLINKFWLAYHRMDKAMQVHNIFITRKWTHHHPSVVKEGYGCLTSNNCLLNLPSIMERCGPLTNFGYLGEKFSQQLKPHLRRVLTSDVLKNARFVVMLVWYSPYEYSYVWYALK
jgi:hypothetical protein